MPGGYVPYEQDFLGAVVLWVEEGLPAETVIASARLTMKFSVTGRSMFTLPGLTIGGM